MNTNHPLRLDESAVYEICVQGRVNDRRAEWFNGLTVTHQGSEAPDEPGTVVTTTFRGPVADQAALLGLLQKLYTLRHPLLLVRRVEASSRADTPTGHPC